MPTLHTGNKCTVGVSTFFHIFHIFHIFPHFPHFSIMWKVEPRQLKNGDQDQKCKTCSLFVSGSLKQSSAWLVQPIRVQKAFRFSKHYDFPHFAKMWKCGNVENVEMWKMWNKCGKSISEATIIIFQS